MSFFIILCLFEGNLVLKGAIEEQQKWTKEDRITIREEKKIEHNAINSESMTE